MMTKEETYNGWKNYPTWAVNLWLSNDEGLYHQTRGMIEGIRETEIAQTDPSTIRLTVADVIRDWVREDPAFGLDLSGFVGDLLGYAIGQVDWLEIADAWLEENEA